MSTLCIVGCGNLGTAILESLLQSSGKEEGVEASVGSIHRFLACVRSERSAKRLSERFARALEGQQLEIWKGDNVRAVRASDVVLLGVDPADVDATLRLPGLADALAGKLLISIVAGWTRERIEAVLAEELSSSSSSSLPSNNKGKDDGGTSTSTSRTWVARTLPNIAATVSQSITAIEVPPGDAALPSEHLAVADAILGRIGQTVHLGPQHMDAFTAVGGSMPAFFAVVADVLIDVAVAVGLPRHEAHTIIAQAMWGTAALLQSGVHPGVLKDRGTSPEGCTIGGLMVLEEAGVRGGLSRALREAVTTARLMGKDPHVNNTRR